MDVVVVAPVQKSFVWGAYVEGSSSGPAHPGLGAIFQARYLPEPPSEHGRFLTELHRSLSSRKQELLQAVASETGFIARDVAETVDAALDMIPSWAAYEARVAPLPVSAGSTRKLELIDAPWGTIVAILPQNAFLVLGMTCMLSALATGNRIVLRTPSNSLGSANILAEAVVNAGPLASRVSIVAAGAQDVLEAFYQSSCPGLVHYFGGSGRIPELLSSSFKAGKSCLADGEGNTWVYISPNSDLSVVATLLAEGVARYNGQTCTSINGAIAHPEIYERLSARLCQAMEQVEVGPLADASRAAACIQTVEAAGGDIVAGGVQDGALLAPTLVLKPDPNSSLVREGIFGPVMWLAPGTETDFADLWPTNRFPLCAAILDDDADAIEWSARLGNLARLVLNGDPSIEDALEPWGGYPGTGNGKVETWIAKYVRRVQVDRP